MRCVLPPRQEVFQISSADSDKRGHDTPSILPGTARQHMMLPGIFERQRRKLTHFASDVKYKRELELEFSRHKRLKSSSPSGVLWLDLERIERRYLLAAAADGSIAAYDVQVPTSCTETGTSSARGQQEQQHAPVLSVPRGAANAHKFSVSRAAAQRELCDSPASRVYGLRALCSVAWYPVDTGLFVSASFDHHVKVWDSNHLEVVGDFDLAARVYAIAMSPIASSHCLVAAAGSDPQVKLCDAASGGFTHTLVGHREPVWAAAWSPTSEWHLVTGACDGQVRFWDIRQSGCLKMFDQHATRRSIGAESERAELNDQRSSVAVAHDGRVTAVQSSPDGLYWLTAATDSRVRLWESGTFRNTLVNYPNSYNRSTKARQLAVSNDSRLLFHPSGSVVQMFRLEGGAPLKVLRGHMETVNCCCYNDHAQELYSGSDDCNIIVWTPLQPELPEEVEADVLGEQRDADAWSDSL